MEIIIGIAIVFIILNQPVVKGTIGELVAKSMLKKLDKSEYTLHKNVEIAKKDGTISPVDQVVVSKYGIFVIEKKNYQGMIFGNEISTEWIQLIYMKKEKIPNPIIENKGHIKSVIKLLDINKTKTISIISCTLRGRLKKVITKTPVVYSVALTNKIKQYKDVLLNDEEIKVINEKLSSVGITK